MSEMKHVLGVDPGETTGLCLLSFLDNQVEGYKIAQCNADSVLNIARAYWRAVGGGLEDDDGPPPDFTVATERFVVGSRAGRSSTPKAKQTTLMLVEWFMGWAKDEGFKHVLRSASEVKPWATNDRLKAAGIKGVGGHSLDAGRHALFAAVKAGYCKDPLSKSYGATA